ncbi:LLM class flavin-dependent oxidoreductase [Ammoniphilus resinae]|uniref:Alkanesulfonate monooxygenase SsuD/methylene tetrahydromethanopterin reductase-like flavin-dependent oxidoreductase (Luciferase family) n=1 Tax=Ammoniphilus resinae TaxID=861532 RepID=A0ABS4GSQ6_9BACL|nr:LLM class flavin-dependent oxidoreductase [Ammoniphilus resinae]MBP1933276.1 alkanesulfonate monooxygenase SsuD/methylene tetrahydromethanopterin reductase-like flavin-dependent oxidoreductase (luciferase family) [Ammoniphilus resinae]
MRFFFHHLMAWPYVTEEMVNKYDAAWVTFPNKHYDPEKGVKLYERYLSELEYAEKIGFDGVCVNEHHQTAYGTMPSPNIMAAALASRTSKVKIAVLGNAIPLRDNPLRIAEEIAMLDVLTNGRIISGFVRGIGPEYHSFSKDPTLSRDKFYEAHDLITKAWTEEGPFEYYAEFTKLRYVNPWPRPVQSNPHPPIWIPSQGSLETIDWVAKKKYTYLQTYSSISNVRRVFTMFKEATLKYGYEASPFQMGWALPIYVAETDEQAKQEARRHIEYLFNDVFKMPQRMFFPDGYLTLKSTQKVLESKKGIGTSYLSFDELYEKEYVIVGSAKTVREKIKKYQEEFGFGNLLGMMHFGTLPHHLTIKNMDLFASEVMPFLRNLGENSMNEVAAAADNT